MVFLDFSGFAPRPSAFQVWKHRPSKREFAPHAPVPGPSPHVAAPPMSAMKINHLSVVGVRGVRLQEWVWETPKCFVWLPSLSGHSEPA